MTVRRDAWPAGLAALVLVTFLPSLNLPLLVVNELTIIGNALQAGRDGWWGWFQWPVAYYRPLIFPLYGGLGAVGGLGGWPFHVALILLHLGMTLWVYRAGRMGGQEAAPTGGARLPAALGAAWFGVTWIKYENVVWGGGLESVAGSALAALAVTAHLSDRPAWRWTAPFLFAVMLLLYQAALLLPLILWWVDRCQGRDMRRRSGAYLLTAVCGLAWVAMAWWMAGPRAFAQTLPQVGMASPVAWIVQVARDAGSLFGYLYAPWDALGRAGTALKYGAGFVTVAGLGWLCARGRPWERVLAGGTLLVAAPICLRTLVEPRYGYLVSAGVCLLVAGRAVAWARAGARWRRAAAGAAALAMIGLGVGYQWQKASQYRAAGARVWEVLDQMKRDIPVWPPGGAVVEGLPLWENRAAMPVPLFGNDLAPTIRAIYGDLDAGAWHAWQTDAPRGVRRIRYTGARFEMARS